VCVDVTLGLVETWGDQHYIGLTGVESGSVCLCVCRCDTGSGGDVG